MRDRYEKQMALYRVCSDSNFRMDAIYAAKFAASVIDCHPMDILTAVGSIENLNRIANGEIKPVKPS